MKFEASLTFLTFEKLIFITDRRVRNIPTWILLPVLLRWFGIIDSLLSFDFFKQESWSLLTKSKVFFEMESSSKHVPDFSKFANSFKSDSWLFSHSLGTKISFVSKLLIAMSISSKKLFDFLHSVDSKLVLCLPKLLSTSCFWNFPQIQNQSSYLISY